MLKANTVNAAEQKYLRMQRLLREERKNKDVPFMFFKIDFTRKELEYKTNDRGLDIIRGE